MTDFTGIVIILLSSTVQASTKVAFKSKYIQVVTD